MQAEYDILGTIEQLLKSGWPLKMQLSLENQRGEERIMNVEHLFQDFVEYVRDRQLFVEAVAVADENRVLLEHHFVPDHTRNIYSHTKSYMATAVGMALAEGRLTLEDRLADYFPESVPEDPDPRLLQITLRDLLTMSSGFGHPYLMGDDRRQGIGFPDYMAYMMHLPMEQTPGTVFEYSTADSILAGRMVEKAVGENLAAYLYPRLFQKLGQGWPQWENDPMGHPIGGGGMYMSVRDMMKLGQLYLAGGTWQGERLLDSGWVREATRKQIETPQTENGDIWRCGYGYQFWCSPYPKAYRADGAFGQVTTVLPENGLVIAVQCPEWGDFEKVKQALHTEIFSQL